MKLTDEEWNLLKKYIPKPPHDPKKGGRPRADDHPIFDGIVWILESGAKWEMLPKEFGPKSNCHRRFQEWRQRGVFRKMLDALNRHRKRDGKMPLGEGFVDATFSRAKKGAT